MEQKPPGLAITYGSTLTKLGNWSVCLRGTGYGPPFPNVLSTRIMNITQKIIGFLMCTLLCAGVMCAGTAMTALKGDPGQSPWFYELVKPVWTPTLEQFAPIWAGLLVCVAIAGWLVWLQQDDEPMARVGLKFYVAMLAFGWFMQLEI